MRPFLTPIFCLALLLCFPGASSAQTPPPPPPLPEMTEKDIPGLLAAGAKLYDEMDIRPNALDNGIYLYRIVLEIDPDNEEAHWRISESACMKAEMEYDKRSREKLYTLALSHAQKAVAVNPRSVPGHFYIGCAQGGLADTGGVFAAGARVKKAKKELQTTVELDPKNRFAILARVVLALINAEAPWPIQDLDKGRELAMEAVNMDPNLTAASIALARVLIRQKHYALARQELNRCLAIQDPTYRADARMFDFPEAKRILESLDERGY